MAMETNGASRLDGKTALVTGGARGLGAAQCRLFASENARVAISDQDGEAAEALAEEIRSLGGAAHALTLDVTSESDWLCAIDDIAATLGDLDILVNNAGIGMLGTVEDMSLADWRRTLAVNLDGVFLGTRAAIQAMKDGGGSIINISSIKAMIGDPLTAAYGASKAGVHNLTKSAALHCAQQGYGIRVNSVHPTYVMTDLVRNAAAELDDPVAFLDEVVGRHPLGELCEPEDVAYAVLYLASDEAKRVTGTELVVDGGYLAQ